MQSMVILLSQPPVHQHYKHTPPHPASMNPFKPEALSWHDWHQELKACRVLCSRTLQGLVLRHRAPSQAGWPLLCKGWVGHMCYQVTMEGQWGLHWGGVSPRKVPSSPLGEEWNSTGWRPGWGLGQGDRGRAHVAVNSCTATRTSWLPQDPLLCAVYGGHAMALLVKTAGGQAGGCVAR